MEYGTQNLEAMEAPQKKGEQQPNIATMADRGSSLAG